MKQDGLARRLLVAFVLALMLYAVAYAWIEHRRKSKGPWEIAFQVQPSGKPVLVVNQPALGITNVQIVFDGPEPGGGEPSTLTLREPRRVPFAVPFGQCVFVDTTSLPGTLAFDMFGHEIQLLPRALTINKAERRWRSGEQLTLTVTNAVQP